MAKKSQARRKRRATGAQNRREKVSRPRLRRYVQRVVILRPLALVLLVAPGAAAFGFGVGKPGLIVIAGLFGVVIAGVLWATTPRKCPVCRTALESDPEGIWVGPPKSVACPRCAVGF